MLEHHTPHEERFWRALQKPLGEILSEPTYPWYNDGGYGAAKEEFVRTLRLHRDIRNALLEIIEEGQQFEPFGSDVASFLVRLQQIRKHVAHVGFGTFDGWYKNEEEEELFSTYDAVHDQIDALMDQLKDRSCQS